MRKIKKGDNVVVIAGRDKGKRGEVKQIVDEQHVLVAGVNQVKKHQKPRPIRDSNRMGGTQIAPGGIIERASAVSASNVMLVCPTCKLPTRVGYRFKEGKGGERIKVRVCKREGCGQELDK